MKHLIEDLWYGNIAPDEKCGVGDPEIEQMTMRIKSHREQLNQELGIQQKEIFEKFVDCMYEYACILSRCAFCDGFSLATQFMSEALSK